MNTYDSDAPISVRLVRVLLCTGEVEVLITLNEARYPPADFERLYAMRWSIGLATNFQKLACRSGILALTVSTVSTCEVVASESGAAVPPCG